MSGASMNRRSTAARQSTGISRIASTQCIWTSSTGASTTPSITACRRSGGQTRLLREIERHGQAEESYMEDGARLLELTRNARQLFVRQPPTRRNGFSIWCCRTANGTVATSCGLQATF